MTMIAEPTDKLVALEQAIVELPIDAEPDAIAELLNRTAFIKEAIKRIADSLEQRILERVQQHGDLTIGTVRYYAGTAKRTEPRDPGQVLDAILQLAGGDTAAAARDFLGSSAFKYGAIKQAAGEQRFAELFEVIEVPELREGKPVKRLLKVDERFTKPRQHPRSLNDER
jgi:hypothetical protein